MVSSNVYRTSKLKMVKEISMDMNMRIETHTDHIQYNKQNTKYVHNAYLHVMLDVLHHHVDVVHAGANHNLVHPHNVLMTDL